MYSPAIIEAFDTVMADQPKSPSAQHSRSGSAHRLSQGGSPRRPGSPKDSLRSLRSSLSSFRHSHPSLTTASA